MVLRADVTFNGPVYKCERCERLLDHDRCRICNRPAWEIKIGPAPASVEEIARHNAKTVDEILDDFIRGVWPEKMPPAGGPDLV